MMKKISVLMLAAAVLALCGIFAACEVDTAERVTVTFSDPGGGNTFQPVIIEKGESLGSNLPTGLTRQGPFQFYGWFDGASQYFADTPIGADITLTARWADEVATVSFAFTQVDDSTGEVIKPAADIPSVTVVKGEPLGPIAFPAAPRYTGWLFTAWLLNGQAFTQSTPVPGDITLTAFWLNKKTPVIPPDVNLPDDFEYPPEFSLGTDGKPKEVAEFTVKFNPGPGVTPIPDIKVFDGECIDEWEIRFPATPTNNPINANAFFVAWLDNENREYDGRTPITRNVTITGKWGLPPHIVDLRMVADGGEIDGLESSPLDGGNYGSTPYDPVVRKSVIDDKWVIVNESTYDVPYNPNRWRILYRIKFALPDDFSVGFYTRYTIRARFYANRQGAKGWADDPDFSDGAFKPNNPADEPGYSEAGWLHGVNSQSDDGWGQISWLGVPNWNGVGSDPDTLLQRYNLDRKGGTINDSLVFAGTHKDVAAPPYLLIQTSDNYIGHIEVYQIVFHNGEWEHTAYEGEEPPTSGAAPE